MPPDVSCNPDRRSVKPVGLTSADRLLTWKTKKRLSEIIRRRKVGLDLDIAEDHDLAVQSHRPRPVSPQSRIPAGNLLAQLV